MLQSVCTSARSLSTKATTRTSCTTASSMPDHDGIQPKTRDPQTERYWAAKHRKAQRELARATKIRDQVHAQVVELQKRNEERNLQLVSDSTMSIKELKKQIKQYQRKNYELDELLDVTEALKFEIRKKKEQS